MAKRDWLARRRPDVRHALVVPGPRNHSYASGRITVAVARLPFGDGYLMPTTRPNSQPRFSS